MYRVSYTLAPLDLQSIGRLETPDLHGGPIRFERLSRSFFNLFFEKNGTSG